MYENGHKVERCFVVNLRRFLPELAENYSAIFLSEKEMANMSAYVV